MKPCFTPLTRALIGVATMLFSTLSFAEGAAAETQVPGYYRIAVGGFQMTALYDGQTNLGVALFKNTSHDAIQAQLARFFINGPALQTAVNAFLVRVNGKLVLIDAGAAQLFGPSLGQIVDNLKAAGYTPEQVDLVLLTHMHGDHVNGLVTPEGKRVFVNADVWSSKKENDFWLDPKTAAKAPQSMQPAFEMAQKAAAPYIENGRWKIFTGEEIISTSPAVSNPNGLKSLPKPSLQIIPGISVLGTPGHTPGHTSYLIENKKQKLLVLGDIVHNHAIQFAYPSTSIDFDTDPAQAIRARKAVFARAAKEKLLVAGMHLPFPGIGHIRKEGKAFAWIPIEFAPLSPEIPAPAAGQ